MGTGKNNGSTVIPAHPAQAAPGSPRYAYSRSEYSSTTAAPAVASTGPSRFPGRNDVSNTPVSPNISPVNNDVRTKTMPGGRVSATATPATTATTASSRAARRARGLMASSLPCWDGRTAGCGHHDLLSCT